MTRCLPRLGPSSTGEPHPVTTTHDRRGLRNHGDDQRAALRTVHRSDPRHGRRGRRGPGRPRPRVCSRAGRPRGDHRQPGRRRRRRGDRSGRSGAPRSGLLELGGVVCGRRGSSRCSTGARRSRATTSPPPRRSSARRSAPTRGSTTPTGDWRRSSTARRSTRRRSSCCAARPTRRTSTCASSSACRCYKTANPPPPESVRLLEDVVAKRPDSYAAQLQLGQHLVKSDPKRAAASHRGLPEVSSAVGGEPRSADPHGARHRVRLRQGLRLGAARVRGPAQDRAERHDRQADARLGARRQELLQPGHLALRAHPVARRRRSRASTTTSAPATCARSAPPTRCARPSSTSRPSRPTPRATC